jgi:molecular chaperone DnaK
MVDEAEKNAETDKARRELIEASNQADSVCADTEKAMNEHKDQLDAAEREKVETHIKELRELALKGQSGDESVTAEQIKNKVGETQQASLGLFQKVYEARAKEASSESSSSSSDSSSGSTEGSSDGEKKP